MKEVLGLIGEIFILGCIQSVFELILSLTDNSEKKVIIDICFYFSSAYLLIRFFSNYILKEVIAMIISFL